MRIDTCDAGNEEVCLLEIEQIAVDDSRNGRGCIDLCKPMSLDSTNTFGLSYRLLLLQADIRLLRQCSAPEGT